MPDPFDTLEAMVPAANVVSRPFKYDIFLCHNSLDKPLVKLIADALQIEAGILFFLDEYSIPASVEFFEFIEAEMRQSATCGRLATDFF